MILFNTYHIELFNYIIHNFLEMIIYTNVNNDNDDMEIGDIIEDIIPKYLFREQYQKCLKVFEELFLWSKYEFYHNMSAFHELALYKFLEYMEDIRNDMEEFDEIYFDDTCKRLIEEASQLDYIECSDLSLDEHKEMYYDINSYSEHLFIDTDFLVIDKIYNTRRLGTPFLEEQLGIDINYYYDLLPLDIQNEYKTKHITLTSEISSLLSYIEHRINCGNLYKLFWENDNPIKEDRIQLIFENIMDAYFYNQEIEITREALLGNGKVDFNVYKNGGEDEKVLIEIKLASSSYVKKGYEKQLTDYMLSTKYKNAFYLIACFTDSEYDKTIQFISNHIYTDTVQLYINISLLDFRKRKTASVL